MVELPVWCLSIAQLPMAALFFYSQHRKQQDPMGDEEL
jgi:hypothetical protein